MAAPVTKWSVQAETADELPLLLHQAFQTALTPPTGPVFVALPINVLEQETDQELVEVPHLALQTLPDPQGIDAAGRMLLEAREPAIVFGDEVHRAGAHAELQSLAEFLGAPVWGTLISPGVGFPMTHPQYRGELPDSHESIRACLSSADLVLLVGGDFFREVFFRPSSPWPEGSRLIQLETSPTQLTRNDTVDLGLAADLKNSLQALVGVLTTQADEDYRAASEARRVRLGQLHDQEAEARANQLDEISDHRPMHPARLMAALRDVLPDDTVVVSEALTAELEVMSLLDIEQPGDFYGSRGGGIGQGLPGGVGAKLAHPDRPVVVLSGDGSALFSIQTLWTAAHHNLAVLFIVLNNRSYRILKGNLDRYRRFFGVDGPAHYPFMDLTGPHIDFVKLAAGFGVSGERIESPERIGPAVQEALATGKPYLLDVVIEG
jgi:benzoylformate decarboxylase